MTPAFPFLHFVSFISLQEDCQECANGRADRRDVSTANHSALISDLQIPSATPRFPPEKIKQLVSELEVPFDESAIDWPVTTTAKGELRGQVVPYADPRA
jgi:hypothetical protein